MGEKNKAQTNKQKSNAHFRILWNVKEKKMRYREGKISTVNRMLE